MSNLPTTSNVNRGVFSDGVVWVEICQLARTGDCNILKTTIATHMNTPGFDIIINDGDETNGSTPLMYACDGGHVDCVKVLITAKGIDVNKIDNNGRTALHWAVQRQKVECANVLLAVNGIKVDSVYNGVTLLGLAEDYAKKGIPGYDGIVAAIKAKSSTGKGVFGLGFFGMGGAKSKSKYRRRKTKRSKKTRKGRSRKH
jgi:hypothetical protein